MTARFTDTRMAYSTIHFELDGRNYRLAAPCWDNSSDGMNRWNLQVELEPGNWEYDSTVKLERTTAMVYLDGNSYILRATDWNNQYFTVDNCGTTDEEDGGYLLDFELKLMPDELGKELTLRYHRQGLGNENYDDEKSNSDINFGYEIEWTITQPMGLKLVAIDLNIQLDDNNWFHFNDDDYDLGGSMDHYTGKREPRYAN